MTASLANSDGWMPSGPKFDPAMRGVRFIQEKGAHQHQQNDAHGGVHHRGFAQAAIIQAHQREHAKKPMTSQAA